MKTAVPARAKDVLGNERRELSEDSWKAAFLAEGTFGAGGTIAVRHPLHE